MRVTLKNTGNRTEWITQVIKRLDNCEAGIMSMITDRHRTMQSPLTN